MARLSVEFSQLERWHDLQYTFACAAALLLDAEEDNRRQIRVAPNGLSTTGNRLEVLAAALRFATSHVKRKLFDEYGEYPAIFLGTIHQSIREKYPILRQRLSLVAGRVCDDRAFLRCFNFVLC